MTAFDETWLDRPAYEEGAANFLSGNVPVIAKQANEKNPLSKAPASAPAPSNSNPSKSVEALEALLKEEIKKNEQLTARVKRLEDAQRVAETFEKRIAALESVAPAPATAPTPEATPTSTPANNDDDDDSDDGLFDDDEEEDPEEEAKKAAILKEYWAKKKAKGMKAARSSIELAVKPWDDETNMEELTQKVLSIEMDGLKWGSHKLKPVGYGINQLVIVAIVEDDKVSTDDLEDKITAFEDHVQSMDVLKFNKI